MLAHSSKIPFNALRFIALYNNKFTGAFGISLVFSSSDAPIKGARSISFMHWNLTEPCVLGA